MKAARTFFVNRVGGELGADVASQMLAFSILRILAGEEELRWYVGTRVSLYAQNNVSSGRGMITSFGSQWGAVLFSGSTGWRQWHHPHPSVAREKLMANVGSIHAGYLVPKCL